MLVRLTIVVELEEYSISTDGEEESEALMTVLQDKDEPSHIHSNYIGDTIGKIASVERLEIIDGQDNN